MPTHDFTSQRLFVDSDLASGIRVDCTPAQANYLQNVLRLGEGDAILVFNGRNGEWAARLRPVGKRQLQLAVDAQTRAQIGGPEIDYVFAPLKRARLDYMVQKATEMGVARLQPVLTQHTVADRVNLDRMRANVIEAAEQCGVLRVPQVLEPLRLETWLSKSVAGQSIVFCDEAAPLLDPLAVLGRLPPGPVAALVGPEGGFSDAERARLTAHPATRQLSLGPRILRADTAAVAVLALICAVHGDWRGVTQP